MGGYSVGGHAATNAAAGLMITDGTKVEGFMFYGPSPTGTINIQTGPSLTNINANTLIENAWLPGAGLAWFRMDDGVTTSGKRTFYLSFDGITFIQIYQESNTQYLTPTTIGYFVDAYDQGTYSVIDVLHWA